MSEDPTKHFDNQADSEKLTQILTVVQELDGRLAGVEARLGSLEQKVEQRLYDTRPIWEKIQTDIAQIHADIVGLKEAQLRLEQGQELSQSEIRDIKTELRDFNSKFSIFNDTLVTMQADYRDIYDRVRDIERQRA
jgi:chromosome segregation ATPase